MNSSYIGIKSTRKRGGFNDVITNICDYYGFEIINNSELFPNSYSKFDDTVPILCDMTTSSPTHDFIKYRRKNNLDYYHIDHAYFWRGYAQDTGNKNPFNCEWFRVSKNCHVQNHIPDSPLAVDSSRWKKYFYDHFNGYGKEYKRTGSKILVCPPSEHVLSLYDQKDWRTKTLQTLREHTDREIVIRDKPNINSNVSSSTRTTLEEDLKDCWALVTHSSCAAITAHLEGIPTFTDENSPTSQVSLLDLRLIERPFYPPDPFKMQWLNTLAFSQYSMVEFSDGTFALENV